MPALQIENLHKVYNNKVTALKGISFTVQQGDFFALLGPNGAGKSTTIGIISALVNKTSGRVQVFDHDIDKEPQQAKRCIGLVPQEFNFHIFEKVIDIVVNQAGYYGVPRNIALEKAEYYLNKLHLWEKRKQPARHLSGGMKRRLLIARALLHEPRLLILDEPTAGVDIEIRRSTWDFLLELNQKGITLILTTHYLEEAENLCKNIAIINHGQIVENTSMRNLLNQLSGETFVFYLQTPLSNNFDFGAFCGEIIDPFTLELHSKPQQTLNEMVSWLNQQNVVITSMRNKANRLETLFLQLIKENPYAE